MEFTEHDIVRHPLVQSIIRAYDARGRQPRDGGRRGSGPGSAGAG
jgi:phosphate starvation-inducible protein PhoH